MDGNGTGKTSGISQGLVTVVCPALVRSPEIDIVSYKGGAGTGKSELLAERPGNVITEDEVLELHAGLAVKEPGGVAARSGGNLVYWFWIVGNITGFLPIIEVFHHRVV